MKLKSIAIIAFALLALFAQVAEAKVKRMVLNPKSLIDFCVQEKLDASPEGRTALAEANGVKNYDRSGDKNEELLNVLKKAKAEKAIEQEVRLVPYLDAKGIESSKTARIELARKHNVAGYNFTKVKNDELLAAVKNAEKQIVVEEKPTPVIEPPVVKEPEAKQPTAEIGLDLNKLDLPMPPQSTDKAPPKTAPNSIPTFVLKYQTSESQNQTAIRIEVECPDNAADHNFSPETNNGLIELLEAIKKLPPVIPNQKSATGYTPPPPPPPLQKNTTWLTWCALALLSSSLICWASIARGRKKTMHRPPPKPRADEISRPARTVAPEVMAKIEEQRVQMRKTAIERFKEAATVQWLASIKPPLLDEEKGQILRETAGNDNASQIAELLA